MKIIRTRRFLLFLLEFFLLTNIYALKTVSKVDLSRYAGTWYEIASYPLFFERGLTHVTATYTPKEGYIEVSNNGIKNGKPNGIKGKAFVVPGTGDAQLKIQFFWPFKSDYWIVGLADDYSWAVVSNPDKSNLWILCRTNKMNPKLYDSLIKSLVENGFDEKKLVKMIQN